MILTVFRKVAEPGKRSTAKVNGKQVMAYIKDGVLQTVLTIDENKNFSGRIITPKADIDVSDASCDQLRVLLTKAMKATNEAPAPLADDLRELRPEVPAAAEEEGSADDLMSDLDRLLAEPEEAPEASGFDLDGL